MQKYVSGAGALLSDRRINPLPLVPEYVEDGSKANEEVHAEQVADAEETVQTDAEVRAVEVEAHDEEATEQAGEEGLKAHAVLGLSEEDDVRGNKGQVLADGEEVNADEEGVHLKEEATPGNAEETQRAGEDVNGGKEDTHEDEEGLRVKEEAEPGRVEEARPAGEEVNGDTQDTHEEEEGVHAEEEGEVGNADGAQPDAGEVTAAEEDKPGVDEEVHVDTDEQDEVIEEQQPPRGLSWKKLAPLAKRWGMPAKPHLHNYCLRVYTLLCNGATDRLA